MPFTIQEVRRWNTFYYRDLYRVKHNSLTLFTKSVYVNGGKDFDMRLTFRNRNSPKYICTPSGRWVSSVAAATSTSTTAEDQALLRWPRRSRDLRPCYFFLWGHSKDSVFPPSLLQDLYKIWRRIIASISEINRDVLQRVWAELDIDLMSVVSRRVDIQSTCEVHKRKGEVLFPPLGRMLQSYSPFKCTDFMKCVWELE